MPTDSKESLLTLATKILGTDYLRIVKDPSGTPLSQNLIAASIKITLIEGLQITWNSATSITVGVGFCIAENGDIINVTSALVKSGLSLSASTWYHIYTYLSGGVPAAEVVTTAPVAWKGTAYSKTGDTTRRYMGSVLTDASGNVYEFQHLDNYITYLNITLAAAPFRCLTAGTATVATAVALSSAVPITTSRALVFIRSTSNQVTFTGVKSGFANSYVTLIAGNTTQQHLFMLHPLDASQQLWYFNVAVVGVGGLYVDVAGYQFKR